MYLEFYRTVSEVIYKTDQICFWKIFKTFRCIQNLMNDMKCDEADAWSKYTSKYELVHVLQLVGLDLFLYDWIRYVNFNICIVSVNSTTLAYRGNENHSFINSHQNGEVIFQDTKVLQNVSILDLKIVWMYLRIMEIF